MICARDEASARSMARRTASRSSNTRASVRSSKSAADIEATQKPLCPSATTSCSATSDESASRRVRSEEHTSELQSLMRISYAVFCLKKKKKKTNMKTKI